MATSVCFFYSGCWYEYQNTTVFQTLRRTVRLCCLCWSGAGSWRLLDGFRLRSWAEPFAACTLEVKVPATLILAIRCQMQGIFPFDSDFNWAVCHHTHTSTHKCLFAFFLFSPMSALHSWFTTHQRRLKAGRIIQELTTQIFRVSHRLFFCITHCFHRCDVLELPPSWKLIH